MTSKPIIGFLGAGEMGANIAGSLTHNGYHCVTPLEGRSQETQERAAECGLQHCSLEQMVTTCDIIFSVLPPSQAEAMAKTIAATSIKTKTSFTFVEANAIAPASVQRIAQLFAESNVTFIDAGLIGAPPRFTPKHNDDFRPKFYQSGGICSSLSSLDGIAFDIVSLGDEIGKASGFKMAYAALTKGTNALMVTCLLAAQNMGLLDPYLKELQDSQSAHLNRAKGVVPRLPADAGRWVKEMEEIRDTFQSHQITGAFHDGAADIMRLLDQSPFGQETRRTRDQNRDLTTTIEIITQSMLSPNKD